MSFKQVQKYESGANRIGASRLYEISMALDTAVENFSDEAPLTIQTSVHSDSIKSITSIGIEQECEKLIEAYYSIPDRQLRKNFMSLLQTLSENE